MTLPAAWLAELREFIRIPSVSADPTRAEDVRSAADWLAEHIRRIGGTAEVVPTKRHPLVVGEVPASRGGRRAPTVLLYGHFDVQPEGDAGAWDSPPFEAELRDGWLYGRGAADDKGNLFLLLKAVELLAADGALPVDVRVVCDGEEEIGGDSVVDFVRDDARGADACVIYDGPMPRRDLPFFYTGTRGLAYYHVRVRTGARDLHSGMFGGAALNATHALMRVLSAVAPAPEALQEGAVLPSPVEVEAWRDLDPGQEVLAGQEAAAADAAAAAEFYERTLARASVDVNGLRGGEPDLLKTVLPVSAEANVSIRLAPGQDLEAICAELERLIRDAAPEGADVELERWSASPPGLIDVGAAPVQLALDAFERTLGRRPILLRCGGTLPIVAALAERGIPTVHTGFDVPEGNIHAPNERLLAEYVPLGVEAARETLTALARLG